MRSGIGNTALAISALSQFNNDQNLRLRRACLKGIRYVTAGFDRNGFVGGPMAIADFPVTATALTLATTTRLQIGARTNERLSRALLDSQRTAKNGWPTEHPDFGGWGMLGKGIPDEEGTDPSAMSATAQALNALYDAQAMTPEARDSAITFLDRCQNKQPDERLHGGFAFTGRATDPLNKAGSMETDQQGPTALPYRTATCDGLTGLLAGGLRTDDHRIAAAVKWLRQSFTATDTERLDEATANTLHGLRFYEAAALTNVCNTIDDQLLLASQRSLTESLLNIQRPDGSWKNPRNQMREDDPLIATCFAIITLANRPTGPHP